MFRRTVRTTTTCVSVLVCGAAFALTGCTDDPVGGARATTTAPSPTPLAQQNQSSPPPCADGQLIVSATDISSSKGWAIKLSFWPVGASGRCTLTGYPGVDTGSGGPLLSAIRTPRGLIGGLPKGDDTPPTVVLDRDHGAQAVIDVTITARQSAKCPTYTDLHVTPPNTTDTQTTPVTFDACEFTVHPVTPIS